MNERIKELAVEADLITHKIPNGLAHLHTEKDLEKFAELIVRQCIKSTLSLHDIAIDHKWDLDETFHMIVDTIVEDLDMQHIFRS